MQQNGAETVFWDLGESPLPIAVPEFHKRQSEHPKKSVRKFNQLVESVDGFILGSPLYHDSFSGVLKNALDNLPPQGFRGRPVALISHSSNARSCVVPCDNLRPVVRSLGGYSTQTQIGTTDDDYAKSKNKLTLTSTLIKDRADSLITELTTLSRLLTNPEREQ